MAEQDVKILLHVSDDGTISLIDQAGKKLGELKGQAENAGRGFSAFERGVIVGNQALQLFEQAVGAARHVIDPLFASIAQADEFSKLSQAIGLPVQELTALRVSASLADTDTGTLARSVGFLSKQMAQGNPLFDAMGVSVKNVDGSLRPTNEVLADMADVFRTLPDGPVKTALALDLLSRGGKAMIPILNEGSAGLREQAAEAQKLGVVYDRDFAASAARLLDTTKLIKLGIEGIFTGAAKDALPVFQDLASGTLRWVEANRELLAQDLGQFLKDTLQVAETLLPIFTAIAKTVAAIAHNAAEASRQTPALGALNYSPTVALGAKLFDAARQAIFGRQAASSTGTSPVSEDAEAVAALSVVPPLRTPGFGTVLTPPAQPVGFGTVLAPEAVTGPNRLPQIQAALNAAQVAKDAKASLDAQKEVTAALVGLDTQRLALAKAESAPFGTILDLERQATADKIHGLEAERSVIGLEHTAALLAGKKEDITATTAALEAKNLQIKAATVEAQVRELALAKEIGGQAIGLREADLARNKTAVDTATYRLDLAQREGASYSTQLALAQQIDSEELHGLEIRRDIVETELRLAQGQGLSADETARLAVMMHRTTDEAAGLIEKLKQNPAEVAKLGAELNDVTAQMDRAGAGARRIAEQFRVTVDLADELDSGVKRAVDGILQSSKSFNLGEIFKGTGEAMASDIIAGFAKAQLKKIEWDRYVQGNFSVTVPSFVREGADKISSIWSNLFGDLHATSADGASGLFQSFDSAFSSTENRASQFASTLSGTLRNIPGVTTLATREFSQAEINAGVGGFSTIGGGEATAANTALPGVGGQPASGGSAALGAGAIGGYLAAAIAIANGIQGAFAAVAAAKAQAGQIPGFRYLSPFDIAQAAGKGFAQGTGLGALGTIANPFAAGKLVADIGSGFFAPGSQFASGGIEGILFGTTTVGTQFAKAASKFYDKAGVPRAGSFEDIELTPEQILRKFPGGSLARRLFPGVSQLFAGDLPPGVAAAAIPLLRAGRLPAGTTPAQFEVGNPAVEQVRGAAEALGAVTSTGGAQASLFANTFINNARLLGIGAKEARQELLELAAAAKVDLQNGLKELNNEFLRNQITQDAYRQSVQGLAQLFAGDLPPGVDAAAVALEHFDTTINGKAVLNLRDFNTDLQRQVKIFGDLQNAIDSAVGAGLQQYLTVLQQGSATLDLVTHGNAAQDAALALTDTIKAQLQGGVETAIVQGMLDAIKKLPSFTLFEQQIADAIKNGSIVGFLQAGATLKQVLRDIQPIINQAAEEGKIIAEQFQVTPVALLQSQADVEKQIATNKFNSLRPSRQAAFERSEQARIETDLRRTDLGTTARQTDIQQLVAIGQYWVERSKTETGGRARADFNRGQAILGEAAKDYGDLAQAQIDAQKDNTAALFDLTAAISTLTQSVAGEYPGVGISSTQVAPGVTQIDLSHATPLQAAAIEAEYQRNVVSQGGTITGTPGNPNEFTISYPVLPPGVAPPTSSSLPGVLAELSGATWQPGTSDNSRVATGTIGTGGAANQVSVQADLEDAQSGTLAVTLSGVNWNEIQGVRRTIEQQIAREGLTEVSVTDTRAPTGPQGINEYTEVIRVSGLSLGEEAPFLAPPQTGPGTGPGLPPGAITTTYHGSRPPSLRREPYPLTTFNPVETPQAGGEIIIPAGPEPLTTTSSSSLAYPGPAGSVVSPATEATSWTDLARAVTANTAALDRSTEAINHGGPAGNTGNTGLRLGRFSPGWDVGTVGETPQNLGLVPFPTGLQRLPGLPSDQELRVVTLNTSALDRSTTTLRQLISAITVPTVTRAGAALARSTPTVLPGPTIRTVTSERTVTQKTETPGQPGQVTVTMNVKSEGTVTDPRRLSLDMERALLQALGQPRVRRMVKEIVGQG